MKTIIKKLTENILEVKEGYLIKRDNSYFLYEKGTPEDYRKRIADENEAIKKIQGTIDSIKKDMVKLKDPDKKKKAQELIQKHQGEIDNHKKRIADYDNLSKALSKGEKPQGPKKENKNFNKGNNMKNEKIIIIEEEVCIEQKDGYLILEKGDKIQLVNENLFKMGDIFQGKDGIPCMVMANLPDGTLKVKTPDGTEKIVQPVEALENKTL